LKNYKPIDILSYIKTINSFSNTYRIMLIILSLVFVQKSLSKLKIIKFI